jgi:hypothetical protein
MGVLLLSTFEIVGQPELDYAFRLFASLATVGTDSGQKRPPKSVLTKKEFEAAKAIL